MQQHVRVALADDDARVRSALVDVLREDSRIEVVGEAASGHEVVVLAEAMRPDVVLVDVAMPGGGMEAVARLRALPHPPIVVVVSANIGRETVIGNLRAGAHGFIAKGGAGDCLAELVVRCSAGEVHLAMPHAGQVLEALLRQHV